MVRYKTGYIVKKTTYITLFVISVIWHNICSCINLHVAKQ